MLTVFCFQTHHPHLTHFFLLAEIQGVITYNINKHCKDSAKEKKKKPNKTRYLEILSYKESFCYLHIQISKRVTMHLLSKPAREPGTIIDSPLPNSSAKR